MNRWFLRSGVILSFIVLSAFCAALLGGEKTFAVNYLYSKSDCKKAGLEFDDNGFGTRMGVGCVFYGGKRGGVMNVISTSQDLANTYPDAYTNADSSSKSKMKSCLTGYKIDNNYKFPGAEASFSACVRDGKDNEKWRASAGLPKGYSKKEDDYYDYDSCKAVSSQNSFDTPAILKLDNKSGFYTGTMGKVCGFLQADGTYVPARQKKEKPKEYRIDKSKGDKCMSGYKEETTTKSGENITMCINKAGKSTNMTNPGTGEDADSGDEDDPGTKCAVDDFGWVVCPGVRGFTKTVISLWKFIADNFLTVKTGELFSRDSEGGQSTYKSWQNFRNLSNIIFIIAVVLIIFSQVTGIGISNYGIKKLLPSIIVCAIMVNVSWYVSVICIEMSNILGKELFNIIVSNAPWEFASNAVSVTENILTGGAVVTGVAILALCGMAFMLFAIAMIAIGTMFIVLSVRTAALIILVVISPVAFAAMLLPNTKPFFDKWKTVFKSLLVIFPVTAVMMGAMVMASNILYNTVTDGNPVMQLVYGLLPAAGLFATATVIKGALKVLDSVTGANITGKINSLGNRARGMAENSSTNNRFKHNAITNSRFGADGIRRKRAALQASRENNFQRSFARSRAEGVMKRFNGKDIEALNNSEKREYLDAINTYNGLNKQDMDAEAAIYATNIGGSEENASALISRAMKIDENGNRVNPNMLGNVIKGMENSDLSDKSRVKLLSQLVSNDKGELNATDYAKINKSVGNNVKGSDPVLSKYIQNKASGDNSMGTLQDYRSSSSAYSGLSDSALAGMGNDQWSSLSNAMTSWSDQEKENMTHRAQNIMNNDKLTVDMDPSTKAQVQAIANSNLSPATQPSTPPTSMAPLQEGGSMQQEYQQGLDTINHAADHLGWSDAERQEKINKYEEISNKKAVDFMQQVSQARAKEASYQAKRASNYASQAEAYQKKAESDAKFYGSIDFGRGKK